MIRCFMNMFIRQVAEGQTIETICREVKYTTSLALQQTTSKRNIQMTTVGLSQFYAVVKYQARPWKTVMVLSTRHKGGVCQTDSKRKPESGLYYNKNKCGVHMLDAICRQMSSNTDCMRWPFAVFFNSLDLACISGWIIFR